MSFTISPSVEEESTEFRSCEFEHVFIGGLRQTLLHADFSHSLISVVQMVKSCKIQYVSDNRHGGKMLDAVDNWCDESYDRVKLGTLYFPIEFYIDRNTIKWIWVKLID